MATYVLIHGAASDSWYWHRVVPELRALGHDVVAPDLPSDDDSAGIEDYADAVVRAIRAAGTDTDAADTDTDGGGSGVIVVAQSLGGFTAPLVCERVPVDLMVLVAAMVASPGEVLGEWWANTGFEAAREEAAAREGVELGDELDVLTEFFHDVPPDVVAAAFAHGERDQSGTPLEKPWPLAAWPDVPTRFLLCRDDRFFPAEFMRRVVQERLGIVPDEMDGGHLPALARPADLVSRLEAYREELLIR